MKMAGGLDVGKDQPKDRPVFLKPVLEKSDILSDSRNPKPQKTYRIQTLSGSCRSNGRKCLNVNETCWSLLNHTLRSHMKEIDSESKRKPFNLEQEKSD